MKIYEFLFRFFLNFSIFHFFLFIFNNLMFLLEFKSGFGDEIKFNNKINISINVKSYCFHILCYKTDQFTSIHSFNCINRINLMFSE